MSRIWIFCLAYLISSNVMAAENRSPGWEFRDCPECPEMVVIPKGSFIMGSSEGEPERAADEGPQHEVTIGYGLAVGKFEVTFAEWDACVVSGGCNGYRPEDEGWGRDRRPVINVSWNDAQAYVKWLSQKTGQKYRLLSESEWEYAARGGTQTPFWWGNTISLEHANYNGNYPYNNGVIGINRRRTVEVGGFRFNSFGLHDTAGNVFEFAGDCYHKNYDNAPINGMEQSSVDCVSRVVRGGSWLNTPTHSRSAFRHFVATDYRSDRLGFRVAVSLSN